MNRFCFKLTMFLNSSFSKHLAFCLFLCPSLFLLSVQSELPTSVNIKLPFSIKALLSNAFDLNNISAISTLKKN